MGHRGGLARGVQVSRVRGHDVAGLVLDLVGDADHAVVRAHQEQVPRPEVDSPLRRIGLVMVDDPDLSDVRNPRAVDVDVQGEVVVLAHVQPGAVHPREVDTQIGPVAIGRRAGWDFPGVYRVVGCPPVVPAVPVQVHRLHGNDLVGDVGHRGGLARSVH